MIHRSLSIASLSVSLFALLATVGCTDSETNAVSVQPTNGGYDVMSMETDIAEGKRATFYFTEAGFLPASTERVEILSAGPGFEWSDDGGPLTYRWEFKLKFAHGAKPASIAVENVTDRKTVEVLLPKQAIQRTAKIVHGGKIYGVANPEWETRSERECRVARDEPCSAWLYDVGSWSLGSSPFWDEGAVFVALRFKITYADGSTETLYQGLSFHPEKVLKRIEAQMAGGKD